MGHGFVTNYDYTIKENQNFTYFNSPEGGALTFQYDDDLKGYYNLDGATSNYSLSYNDEAGIEHEGVTKSEVASSNLSRGKKTVIHENDGKFYKIKTLPQYDEQYGVLVDYIKKTEQNIIFEIESNDIVETSISLIADELESQENKSVDETDVELLSETNTSFEIEPESELSEYTADEIINETLNEKTDNKTDEQDFVVEPEITEEIADDVRYALPSEEEFRIPDYFLEYIDVNKPKSNARTSEEQSKINSIIANIGTVDEEILSIEEIDTVLVEDLATNSYTVTEKTDAKETKLTNETKKPKVKC